MKAFSPRPIVVGFARPAATQPRHSKFLYRHASTAKINTKPPQDSQVIPLPDGRQLGFAEYGSLTGIPLFYFHGTPGSRLEASRLHEICQRRGIRAVTPERPGVGLSSFQPNRCITDFAADVMYLASHLGFKRFAVLGYSGGGPYALACARAIPSNMISAVGLVSTTTPPELDLPKAFSWQKRSFSWASTYVPSVLAGLTDTTIKMLKKVLYTDTGKAALNMMIIEEQSPEKTAETNDQPRKTIDSTKLAELRELKLRHTFEPFAQGSRAFIEEYSLLRRPWGFPLEDVPFNKIQCWHGVYDTSYPISMVRRMKDQLPHCQLHECVPVAHFDMRNPGHLEEILNGLIPSNTTSPGLGKQEINAP